jgi:hypothetical protein
MKTNREEIEAYYTEKSKKYGESFSMLHFRVFDESLGGILSHIYL